MRSYQRWPKYISVADKKEMAEDNLKKLNKKSELSPIIINDKNIVNNWWGKAWCNHLKKYADYDNRIARGKSYVKNNLILDLKITDGKIDALVQGTRKKPYEVNINIKECSEEDIKVLQKKTLNNLASVDDLLNGKFPKELGDEFLESSLFPNYNDIDFNCSCPDWANMCKHISGVLYGIGAKLDKSPELLFTLRGVNIENMISKKLKENVNKIVVNKKSTKRKIIDDKDINELFNID